MLDIDVFEGGVMVVRVGILVSQSISVIIFVLIIIVLAVHFDALGRISGEYTTV